MTGSPADYRAVFDALPLPATIVDADGTILDLNQASIELAHRVGRVITKADRIGQPLVAFARPEEGPERLTRLIQDALQEGRSQLLQWFGEDAAGHRFWMDFLAAAVHDSAGRATGAVVLRQDVSERVRRDQQRSSQERLRDALWRMSRPDDLLQVLRVLQAELVALCPQIEQCSVQLRDAASDHWHAYYLTAQGQRLARDRVNPDLAVVICWRDQQPVYRADLAADDPYSEAVAIEAAFGPAMRVRSVLDVPFVQGTLAVNSAQPEAFGAQDVAILTDMARLLAVGLARLQDLERLAQRNLELEREVTERRQAEERLARSEERYRRLVEAPQDLVVLYMDPSGTCLYVGPQLEAATGHKPEQVLQDARHLAALVHPEDRGPMLAAFRRAVRTADEQRAEFRYRHVDGSWHWAAETLTPIRDAGGGVEAVQAVLQEITQKRRSEEQLHLELQLQRLRNRSLTMASDDDWDEMVRGFEQELRQWIPYNAFSINVVDRQTGTLTAYAVGPERGVHRNVGLALPAPMLDAMVAVMESGQPLYRRSRKDPLFPARPPADVKSCLDVAFVAGTVALNSLSEDAFTARDAEILERFADVASQAYRRVTDLRAVAEAEARFRQAQKMEAVGHLAGGVAHDFNNILTAISGFSELGLLQPGLGPSVRTNFAEILAASRRGSSLTQQLLAFSRRQVIRPQAVDVNASLASLGKMLGRLLGEGVVLVTDLDPQRPCAQVDPGQLEQIVLNLAVNARDAMPTGGRLILRTAARAVSAAELRPGAALTPGSYVVLTVEDTGTGMSEEVREHAFEPFYTTKETGKGTGLGLAMVYGAAKQNGGHVLLDSEPGRGTRFDIYLPQTEDPTGAAASRADLGRGGGSETVLVVEDDAAVRDVVCRMLTHHGYATVAADSGEEALRLAEQRPSIDLLVTDVVMPGMGGRALSATLTALRPGLPTLYMSGYLEGGLTPEELARPGVSFLQKPIVPEDLSRQVRRLLDGVSPA